MQTIEKTKPVVLKKQYNKSYDNKPSKKVEVWSLKDLINNVLTKQVNPDPITQRPQVTEPNKPLKIIEALINDGTFGAGIILRDIRNDVEAQKLYPGVSYLIIDGGHRTRALVSFYNGELIVKDLDGNNITIQDIDTVNMNLDEEHTSVTIYTCTSEQAKHIFRSVNKVTQTNFMEDIMADETSVPCKETRILVRKYKEYNNIPHKLFSTVKNKSGKEKPEYFDGQPNPRNKWMEYVMCAMIKAINKLTNNPSTGEKELTEFSELNEVPKYALKVVNRFFNDCVNFVTEREQKFNPKTFALFQLVWFGLYSENQDFVITDYKKFTQQFMTKWTKLTDKTDDTLIKIDNVSVIKTKYFFDKVTHMAHIEQNRCYDMFREDLPIEDLGVIYRDAQRSKSRDQREIELIKQNYKCYIDNKPLTLDDSVWGHDIDWASGGSTLDGKVIRKTHNQRMGMLTLEEYRNTL